MVHLLEKAPDYQPDRQPFLKWCYYTSVNYFLSHFRQQTNRRRLRRERAEEVKPAKKGVVRHGKVFNLPPGELIGGQEADDLGNPGDREYGSSAPSPTHLSENRAYDEMGLSADPRPLLELRMDLQELIPQMPEESWQRVIRLVLEDVPHDKIGWRLGMHPTTVSHIREKAINWLRERMS